MILSKRQLSIVNRIMSASEPVNIKNLALDENVTPQTIYNDLQSIKNIEISIKRGNIGIVVKEGQKSVVRQKILKDRLLREKACDYVINNLLSGNSKGVIFIDGGSTGYLFFRRLQEKMVRDLIIITNNPLVIGSIFKNEEFFYQNSVFVTGGKLDVMRISLYSIVQGGDLIPGKTENNFIDFCFLGFLAISPTGDLYIGNEEEVAQKKLLISKSKHLILIASADKLGATGLFKIASLSKENKIKDKNIHITVAGDEPLSKVASATLKNLSELLGKSSVNIVD